MLSQTVVRCWGRPIPLTFLHSGEQKEIDKKCRSRCSPRTAVECARGDGRARKLRRRARPSVGRACGCRFATQLLCPLYGFARVVGLNSSSNHRRHESALSFGTPHLPEARRSTETSHCRLRANRARRVPTPPRLAAAFASFAGNLPYPPPGAQTAQRDRARMCTESRCGCWCAERGARAYFSSHPSSRCILCFL